MRSVVRIKFLYFAKLKELLKTSSQEIEINRENTHLEKDIKLNENEIILSEEKNIILKVKDIFNLVIRENHKLKNDLEYIFKSCLLSINDDYIENNPDTKIKLSPDDIISILPPISAG